MIYNARFRYPLEISQIPGKQNKSKNLCIRGGHMHKLAGEKNISFKVSSLTQKRRAFAGSNDVNSQSIEGSH